MIMPTAGRLVWPFMEVSPGVLGIDLHPQTSGCAALQIWFVIEDLTQSNLRSLDF